MLEVYGAVVRKGEDGTQRGTNDWEKISMYDTLRAYTYGSAYAIGREDVLGTLETGKFADVIVLDKNLFETIDKEILDTNAVHTVLGGKVTYEKEAVLEN